MEQERVRESRPVLEPIPISCKPSPPPSPGGGLPPCTLRLHPPDATHRVPTFGVEVHAQPGTPTLALRALQVLPDEHILHLIQNGQDCPTRWTQGRPMSGQTGLPGGGGDPPPPSQRPQPSSLAAWVEDGVESGRLRVCGRCYMRVTSHVVPVNRNTTGHLCVSAAYRWRVAGGLHPWSL